ncbi:MAG: hypothetical protein JWQ98_744 [Chlorobi bacterium]|nr:hypothetical protein [Chlorobiota bacterium]
MAIQPSFGEAVMETHGGSKASIAGAMTAVQNLETTLNDEVLPLFK